MEHTHNLVFQREGSITFGEGEPNQQMYGKREWVMGTVLMTLLFAIRPQACGLVIVYRSKKK